MSQPEVPRPADAASNSAAPEAEKHASSSTTTTITNTTAKPRSCVICRKRKVRCDKLSPCTNCKRANIACVVPSDDRPPRWARRLDRFTNSAASPGTTSQDATAAAGPGAGLVMDRLKNLEGLVKELTSQLEQANAANASAAASSSGNSPKDVAQAASLSGATASNLHQNFGRLVVKDSNRNSYVSSGFWSRVSDELDALKSDAQGLAPGDSDSSEDDEPPPTHELDRTPAERHGFMFGHNLAGSAPDLRQLRPLPSQILYLIDVFSTNVNYFLQVVHIPSVTDMMRQSRAKKTDLSPANEALMFAIYYAAVTSMDEEEVMANLGSPRSELNLKFRLGLEHALARADFLNNPDITLVQAFATFLFLVRRHDSPRFVWMMTGVVIRMAQALGMHRDGSNFKELSPYEVEMRRRIWWALCLLDIRASEDQGSEFTITSGSFDTKYFLSINDGDISPETKETPQERQGMTDATCALISAHMSDIIKKMMGSSKQGAERVREQIELLDELSVKSEAGIERFSDEASSLVYWVGIVTVRLVVKKLTLFVYLPGLFSSPDKDVSDQIRDKLLVAALEVAEYNHALNAEQRCKQWRWLFQTYTHWYAIVYLLIEISRRPWSPIVERCWFALHSAWLIPSQRKMRKNQHVWLPLKKLMNTARNHRETELRQIRGDAKRIQELELSDRAILTPQSSGPFAEGTGEQQFLNHWRIVVSSPSQSHQSQNMSNPGLAQQYTPDQGFTSSSQGSEFGAPSGPDSWSYSNHQSTYQPDGQGVGYTGASMQPTPSMDFSSTGFQDQAQQPLFATSSTLGMDWTGGQAIGSGFTPWLWADPDPNVEVFAGVDVDMDLNNGMDWNEWMQSAVIMDMQPSPSSSGAGS